MQGEKIALPKQRFLIHLRVFRAAALTGDGVEDNLTAEGLCQSGHSPSDIAHSHNAPGLSLQLIKGNIKVGEPVLCPIGTGLYIIVIVRKLLAQCQSQSKGVLCHHTGGIIHHIAHLNPSGFAILQITIVKTGSQLANQLYIGSIL